MDPFNELSTHLKNRLNDLREAGKQGRKIIGYLPGGYMPEELILACDAIPICFIRGGDHSMVEYSGAYICRWIDTFCRAQIGYGISGEDPYYRQIDLLAVPITDNHIRAVMDVLDYNTNIDIFPFGVPHMKEESTFDYYLQGLHDVKSKLEKLTGVKITDEKLNEAITLCNEERSLFKKISIRTAGQSKRVVKTNSLLNYNFLKIKQDIIGGSPGKRSTGCMPAPLVNSSPDDPGRRTGRVQSFYKASHYIRIGDRIKIP